VVTKKELGQKDTEKPTVADVKENRSFDLFTILKTFVCSTQPTGRNKDHNSRNYTKNPSNLWSCGAQMCFFVTTYIACEPNMLEASAALFCTRKRSLKSSFQYVFTLLLINLSIIQKLYQLYFVLVVQ